MMVGRTNKPKRSTACKHATKYGLIHTCVTCKLNLPTSVSRAHRWK